jgi:hypothetical protein
VPVSEGEVRLAGERIHPSSPIYVGFGTCCRFRIIAAQS